MLVPPVVNLHIYAKCNLKCLYCYEVFPERPRSMPLASWQRLLSILADDGVKRITFSGGEPTLRPELLLMLVHARGVGLQTSIITNGARLSDKMIDSLDLVSMTLDAIDPELLEGIGRSTRKHCYLEKLRDVAARTRARGVPFKLNTVVSRLNIDQELSGELRRLRPATWKPMQFTHVVGENDEHAEALLISHTEFAAFVARHQEALLGSGIQVSSEAEASVRTSYVMIEPTGRLFQTSTGRKAHSRPVLDVGLRAALAEVGGYDDDAFRARGGDRDVRLYKLSKKGGK